MNLRKSTFVGASRAARNAAALGVCLGLGLATGGQAQIDQMKPKAEPALILAQAASTDPETVRILAALAKIESDLNLGMLFLQDGLTNPEGSHFAHPRAETLPGIAAGLAAAGAQDLEPLLLTLEGGGDAATVTANFQAVITGTMLARSSLKPTNRDLLLSIVAQTDAIAAEINSSGPTEVNNYQDAWAMLMVARMQVDQLLGDSDPNVAAGAAEMGIAMDDVILSMPDPNVTAPVEFDAAPILAIKAGMETLAGTM